MEAKEFDFVEYIPKEAKLGVAIIVLKPYRGIYLTERFKTKEFGCPGGKVDDTDFSLEDAARRELKEETGLAVEEERLHWVGYQKVTTQATTYTSWYLLILKDGETLENVEPSKHGEWTLYKLYEAKKLPLFCGTGPTLEKLSSRMREYALRCRDAVAVEEMVKVLPMLG